MAHRCLIRQVRRSFLMQQWNQTKTRFCPKKHERSKKKIIDPRNKARLKLWPQDYLTVNQCKKIAVFFFHFQHPLPIFFGQWTVALVCSPFYLGFVRSQLTIRSQTSALPSKLLLGQDAKSCINPRLLAPDPAWSSPKQLPFWREVLNMFKSSLNDSSSTKHPKNRCTHTQTHNRNMPTYILSIYSSCIGI